MDNKLLIRIDERQKEMSKDISDIKENLSCTVRNDKNYEIMCSKVSTLWDDRNKVLGWMLGAGVAGGGITTLLSGFLKTVFAKF